MSQELAVFPALPKLFHQLLGQWDFEAEQYAEVTSTAKSIAELNRTKHLADTKTESVNTARQYGTLPMQSSLSSCLNVLIAGRFVTSTRELGADSAKDARSSNGVTR